MRARSFNEIFGEAVERSDRVVEILRARHAAVPFNNRDEIRAAYEVELRILEAGMMTTDDEVELNASGITI